MSEENYNSSEETEALFVAKHKKQEEDKKAAQEQAERDLKEAEVARMEAELREKKEKAAKMRKIGIIVAVLIAIATMAIIFFVINRISRIGKVDYAGLQYDAEYTPQSSDHKITFRYPGEFYPNVSESYKDTSGIYIDFVPEKSENVTTRVSINYLEAKQGKKLTIGSGGDDTPKTYQDLVVSLVESALSNQIPDAVVSDVVITDYTAENPGKYFYSSSFTSKENSGGAAGWVEIANEIYEVVGVFCMAPGEDATDGKTMRDAFVENNADDALQVAGMNPPPADAPLDGKISYDPLGFSMSMPKDMFYPDERKNFICYGDTNGAGIMICPEPYLGGFDGGNFDIDKLFGYYEERASRTLDQVLIGVTNREMLDPDYTSYFDYDFSRTYTFERDGTKYMEIFFVFPWNVDEGEDDYFIAVEFFYPYANKDAYTEIFERSIEDFIGF